jgi:3-oxoacyl-[acyl-carrier-protein] synthase III
MEIVKRGADTIVLCSCITRGNPIGVPCLPVALCEASSKKLVNKVDNLVLVGFGGGLTWGAGVIKIVAAVNA